MTVSQFGRTKNSPALSSPAPGCEIFILPPPDLTPDLTPDLIIAEHDGFLSGLAIVRADLTRPDNKTGQHGRPDKEPDPEASLQVRGESLPQPDLSVSTEGRGRADWTGAELCGVDSVAGAACLGQVRSHLLPLPLPVLY